MPIGCAAGYVGKRARLFPRWSAEQANDWYAHQPWLVGANFIPSDAINQLEMFQRRPESAAERQGTGLAEGIGMNMMRVFLQDQL